LGTVTIWVTEEITWLALSALAVAVLVTGSPSLSGPVSGTRMAMSTSAVVPATRPTEPAGLGGAGSGEVNVTVSLRVAGSKVTVRVGVDGGSVVTSNSGGRTSSSTALTQDSWSEEQDSVSL
jgi:hypothetical protein